MENWLDIKGYEGLYKVSDLGRIISFHRRGNGRYCNPIIMKICGRQVSLNKNGVKKMHIVSHLVWNHFVGKVQNGYVIDHIIEGNYLDNRLCNLQCIPQALNSKKASENGRYRIGGLHGRTNITDEQAQEIVNLKKSGVKRKVILQKFQITPDQFYNIVGSKFWLHLDK